VPSSDFSRDRSPSKRRQLGQSGRVLSWIAELGTGAALFPTAVAQFAVFLINRFPYGALIVIVVDIRVALANGMPGWNLCHQSVQAVVVGPVSRQPTCGSGV
jgi:hypothetical protein